MRMKILIAGIALLAAASGAQAATGKAAPSCVAPGALVYRCTSAKPPVHAAPLVRHRVVRAAAPCRCRTVARASHRIFVRRDAGLAYAQSGYRYRSQSYGGGYAWQSPPVDYGYYAAPAYQPVRTYQYGAYYGYNVGDGGPGGDRGDPWAGYNPGYGNGY